jgi:hemoglobin
MNSHSKQTILAHEIGLCRIAKVVNEFYSRVQQHPTLQEPFRVVGDWGDHRARLTYFWWTVLGGKGLGSLHFNVVPKHVRAGFTVELLSDWLTLFREVVYSIVPRDMAGAWMDRATRLGKSLVIANHAYLAKAS